MKVEQLIFFVARPERIRLSNLLITCYWLIVHSDRIDVSYQFDVFIYIFPFFNYLEQATDASLASENWALNMEICDIINETEDAYVSLIFFCLKDW